MKKNLLSFSHHLRYDQLVGRNIFCSINSIGDILQYQNSTMKNIAARKNGAPTTKKPSARGFGEKHHSNPRWNNGAISYLRAVLYQLPDSVIFGSN